MAKLALTDPELKGPSNCLKVSHISEEFYFVKESYSNQCIIGPCRGRSLVSYFAGLHQDIISVILPQTIWGGNI
jgi:hypothetical protein